MKLVKLLAIPMAFVTAIASSFAQAENAIKPSWNGHATIGGIKTTGNTETQNTTAGLTIARHSGHWTQQLAAATFMAETNNVESADRSDISYQLNRDFGGQTYAFGRLSYDTDEFGNIDSRTGLFVGLGRHFFDNGDTQFSGEFGVGQQDTDFLTLAPASGITNLSSDDTTYYLGLDYHTRFADSVTFNSRLLLEQSDLNTLTVWDNDVTFAMTEHFALSIGVSNRRNSDILGTLNKKSDTTTNIRLVYGF